MKRIFNILILVGFITFYSCNRLTSTPDEFINANDVELKTYENDTKILINSIKDYYRKTNMNKKPNQVVEISELKIDTIFYGKNDKIVFLAVLNKKNNYAKEFNSNSQGIQYSGECYIGLKNKIDNSVKIVDKLKYNTTSTESYSIVSNRLKEIYLIEMNRIENRFNINDQRFWDSNVWD